MQRVCRLLIALVLLATNGNNLPSGKPSISFIAPHTFVQPTEVKAPTVPDYDPDGLDIVMVAPEADPFSKVGGLGDYQLGLPTALRNEGQRVTVISPLYLVHNGDERRDVSKREMLIEKHNIQKEGVIDVYVRDQKISLNVYTTELSGVRHYFLDHPTYFRSAYDDQVKIFQAILLSRGSLQLMQALNMTPNIIHTNDWPASLVSTYLKTDSQYRNDARFGGTKTTHVIHNSGVGYQGEFGKDVLPYLGLSSIHHGGFIHQYPESMGGATGINLTAAALRYHADHVVTVSNGFRDETLTEEFAQGIEPYLQERLRKNQYHGIVNGTDLSDWLHKLNEIGGKEKAKEALLSNFDQESPERRALEGIKDLNYWLRVKNEYLRILKGETSNPRLENVMKQILRTGARLTVDKNAPVMGMVTRIVWQKGIKLTLENIRQALDRNPELAFVFLGSGESLQEIELKQLEWEYPGRVSITIDFVPSLADKIYLGADMFLMPSKYEPCGIAQLNAMAVGTVPIVSATGGLDETVNQFNPRTGEGAGVKFENFDGDGIQWAINRSVELYHDELLWGQMTANARRRALTYTWKNSARDYMRMWRWIVGREAKLASDKVKKPSALLYEDPRREDLELDEWDRENYYWDGSTEFWRSKVFPQLVLGSHEDLETTDGAKLDNHIAIRMRAGWTLYIVEDSKWAIAYIEEAKLRGEVPTVGNNQIYISSDSSHLRPTHYIDQTALKGASDSDRLRAYQEYVESSRNGVLNTVLAEEGTILNHYWIHGNSSEIERFAPLAGAKSLFFGVSPTRFLKMHRGGAQRTGIIHIGRGSDEEGGHSLGHILGFLNRLQGEDMTPSTVIISNTGAHGDINPLIRMSELAKRIPEEVFPDHRLVRSLDQPAGFDYWDFVFQRLFKRFPNDKVVVTVSYNQGPSGIYNEDLVIPGILFKRENHYLVARYLAANIYNRAITEGAQKVGISIPATWLQEKITQDLQKELEEYEPTFSDLGNFGEKIDVIAGAIEPTHFLGGEVLQPVKMETEKVSIGFHVSASGINLVAMKKGEVVHKKGNSVNHISANKRGGIDLQRQIFNVLGLFLNELAADHNISRDEIESIGFAFPGPVHKGKTIRWVNFEEAWAEKTGPISRDGFATKFEREYAAINALKELIPSEFGIARVAFVNSADAHGLAEIKARNGTMSVDADASEDVTRVVLKISDGVGYAKIKNGALDGRPNEGGHLALRISNPNVRCDGCGVAGCLEQHISVRGIRERGSIFNMDWTNGEFSLKNIFKGAARIQEQLQHFAALQTPLDEDDASGEVAALSPISVDRFSRKNTVISYQVLNGLADMYADAIERFLHITKANQVILTGNLVYEDNEAVLLKLIREKFKAKYQDRFPAQANSNDFIVYGQADSVFGSAEGAAMVATQALPVQLLEATIAPTSDALEAAI